MSDTTYNNIRTFGSTEKLKGVIDRVLEAVDFDPNFAHEWSVDREGEEVTVKIKLRRLPS